MILPVLTFDQLDALPLGAAVLDGDRDVWQRYTEGWISILDITCQSDELAEKFYPIHLLWDGTPPNEGNQHDRPPDLPAGLADRRAAHGRDDGLPERTRSPLNCRGETGHAAS